MTAANRVSTYTSTSTGTDGRNGEQKNLWTSMLGSVASGKRLPEKNVLVLGSWPSPFAYSLPVCAQFLLTFFSFFRWLAGVSEGVPRFAVLGRPAADNR